MDGTRSPRAARPGFTLVELLVAATITAVLLALAVPGFQRLQASTRVRQEVLRLMSDIVFTRSEAIKRNVQVIMCPSPPGDRDCAGTFARGWLIFEDRDRDRRLDPDETVLRTFSGLHPDLTLTNRAATRDAAELIAFLPDGSSRRNRTLMLCSTSRPEISSWSVVMNIVGRPRLARGFGTCASG